ncbi:2-polyprenyl-6-methoxyphenol hydroxylase-like FAD-dependent oxidoreductase [Streptacidiphilus sp. MAP12-33]|uniref:FAD-dependent oxidoreductase n=1 Tax=Streptacidiphilus sp. MAP12-33 TaxID=3156266 RepID=UPI003518FE5D
MGDVHARDLSVAVAGAGLGGLCLAQGLRRSGFEVDVYERDDGPDARPQGYRLHLDARAGLALEQCLPPGLLALFQATCGLPSRRFTVLSPRLRVLHEVVDASGQDPYAPGTLSTSVHRRTLREVLGTGLADRIHHGRAVTGYAVDGQGVQVRFADGDTARADLLVGADGVHSAVRRQLLPHAVVDDTGGRALYGRTPLTERTRALLPPALLHGFTAVVGGRTGVAAGLVRLREQPPHAAARLAPEARLSPVPDYLMWAVSAQAREFGVSEAALDRADPTTLHTLACRAVRNWHPQLRELVAAADVADTFVAVIRSAEELPAWRPSRVTLLGDAIHAMSPARGSGANTALQDAALLCRVLTERRDDSPAALVAAVGAYEERMRDYGFAAVAASRKAEAETGTGRLASWLLRRLG